ncbi:MAG: hypothetical protein GX633_00655, partial [Clostridiales bacterium]|nr:hypothetical protein [Clostridiales bacterium]
KNPLICTYGDQLIQDRVGQRIDEEWVMDFVRTAEEKWGHKNINLIIDDSWQHCQSFQPKSDTARFPDMRALSDKLHERGHKVILWTRPLFDNVLNGFETLSQQYNILTSYSPASAMPDYYKGSYMIDYTADTARDFLHEICLGLFGSGEGQFDADGVKLDFIGTIRDPSLTDSYSHPEKGIGMRELYLFYKMFSEEARKIKSDVLIDCTVGDPRFEGFITHNRLHDTHAGVEEKELRAKLSTLACPGLIVDCDGALMYSHWLRNHYISAAVYSVPSNYYLNGFQDYRNWNGLPEKDEEWAKHHDLDDREKLDFGALLDMTAYRPDGNPVMDDFGQWRLVTEDGQTNAYSKRGDTVIYYPEREGETGYIFTFRSEAQILPLFGRKISDLTPAPWRDTLQLDYARDRFITHLIPGVVYTFRWEDSGDSIDRAFREADTGTVEGEVDYVN